MNQKTPPKIAMLISTIERDGVRAETPEQALTAVAALLQRLDAEAILVSVHRFSQGMPVDFAFRHLSTGQDEWRATVTCATWVS